MSAFPRPRREWTDPAAERVVEALRALVTRVRNFRSERGAPPMEPVELSIDPASPEAEILPALESLGPLLSHLGRLAALRFEAAAEGSVRDVVAGIAVGLSLARPARPSDRTRIEKTLSELEEEIQGLAAKLRNPSFLDRAPAPVVEKARRRLVELEQRRAALSGASA